jgi:hypothetical protein
LGFSSTGLPPEPKTIDAALSSPEDPHWQAAMEEEPSNLQELDTWESTSLPADCRAIPCMWDFERKLNSDGTIERYKAGLVIQGFHQRYMIDYDHVFAPVVRSSMVRLFFSIVASAQLEFHMIVIKNGFIQREVDSVIYMSQPHPQANSRVTAREHSVTCI